MWFQNNLYGQMTSWKCQTRLAKYHDTLSVDYLVLVSNAQSKVCIEPTLQWRHNDHDSVSSDQPHGCLLNRLCRRNSKKTSKLRVTGLCVGNSPGPVNSPHKWPVTRKMFPFDEVIMMVATMVSDVMHSIVPLKSSNTLRIILGWCYHAHFETRQ